MGRGKFLKILKGLFTPIREQVPAIQKIDLDESSERQTSACTTDEEMVAIMRAYRVSLGQYVQPPSRENSRRRKARDEHTLQ
jgi:hypothetical protein